MMVTGHHHDGGVPATIVMIADDVSLSFARPS
jgi:hypothetical protein